MRRLCKIISVAAVMVATAATGTVDDASFKAPPRKFAPHVWWHWMNGNISKEGITADLEALADVGIAAATFFDASCGIESGPVKFDTPEFYDAARHAAKEAKRLGLTLGVANCSGWANSGGPWVTPRDSMKFVTVSETAVEGPSRFEGTLPRTKDDNGFYGDIAVLAVKDHSRRIDVETTITGNVATVTSPVPVTVAGFSWRIDFKWRYAGEGTARIEVSDDGVTFRHVEDLPFMLAFFNTSMWNVRRHTFKRPLTFKALRFSILKSKSKSPPVLVEFRPETEQRIEDIDGKTYHYKKPLEDTVIEELDGSALEKGGAIDLTSKMSSDGRIAWDVPQGKWKILRFGYCANGKLVSKSGTDAGRGLEVDRFDPAAVARHFESYVGKLKRHCGEYGDAITMVLNDSYEAESQNWSHGFEREFERSAGYPILQWLPALTGRIVGSIAETEKFLADFRRVLSCAFVENYVRTLYNKAHEHGMEFYLEPYGNGSFDDLQYARYCDVPMCEFWASERTDFYFRGTGPELGNVEMIVKSADAWGHDILGAEAFTVGYDHGKWQVTPHSIKCQGDHAYELGVNRMIYHRFVHQPWKTPKYPGMTMGPWGMHFDRTQTWWKEAKEFVRYQTRCQYMLQQGRKLKDDVCHRQDTEADWYFVTSAKHSPVTVEKSFAFDGRVPEIWYPETGETVRAARWRVDGGRVTVSVRLPVAGSAFVVFRSANPDVPAERWLEEVSRTEVSGPWNVSFTSPAGGEPPPMTFDALADWSLSETRALRYFSGSAHYRKTLSVPALKPGERMVVDLGDVKDFATVTVNGHEHPALWKPPFTVDVTDDVGADGRLELSVKVTNRWPNRLIGDDALPESERGTWTSWRHWKSTDEPLPSGLLGPVSIVKCDAMKTGIAAIAALAASVALADGAAKVDEAFPAAQWRHSPALKTFKQNPDGTYAAVELLQKEPAPFVVRFAGEAVRPKEHAMAKLMIDVTYATGVDSHEWGNRMWLDFSRPGRQEREFTFYPSRPVRHIDAYLSVPSGCEPKIEPIAVEAYEPAGNAILDGVPVDGEVPRFAGFYVRDAAAESGYSAISDGQAAKGLKLAATAEIRDGARFYTAELCDVTGKDRATTLVFAVPLPDGDIVWYDDIRRSRKVDDASRAEHCETLGGETARGPLSRWPIGAVTVGGRGVAIGVDPALPGFYRLAVNPRLRILYVAYDIGLASPEKSSGRVGFVVYGFNAADGMRGALERYQALFPDYHRDRAKPHGLWSAFYRLSNVKDVQDFGIRYNECEQEISKDDENGFLSLRYKEPCTWWMKISRPDGSKASYEECLAMAKDELRKGTPDARAWETSVFRDEAGWPAGWILNRPWCNGIAWSMNAAPGIGGFSEFLFKQGTWEICMERYSKPKPTGWDGEYIDSVEFSPTLREDFDRRHFPAMKTPLVYSADRKTPCIYTGLCVQEYMAEVHRRMLAVDRISLANGSPYSYSWLVPQMDVPGTEVNWCVDGSWKPDPEGLLVLRRALAGPKPYCCLMSTPKGFTSEMTERYFKVSLAYGFMPGFQPSLFKHGLHDRDRALFKRYVPLCKLVSEAGWRPVNRLVSCSGRGVVIEQFGDRYLTLFNHSKFASRAQLRLLDGSSRICADILSGRSVAFSEGAASVVVDAGDVILLDVRE